MRKLFLFLSLGIFLFSCKEVKKETKPSPYQPLADQYAEFPLTTDLNQLTENEKKMLPILIEVANIMEDICTDGSIRPRLCRVEISFH